MYGANFRQTLFEEKVGRIAIAAAGNIEPEVKRIASKLIAREAKQIKMLQEWYLDVFNNAEFVELSAGDHFPIRMEMRKTEIAKA